MARADENARTWSRWIQAAMAAAGTTQADLERLGVATSGTLSKWVRGEYAPNAVETVIAVAHALGAPDAVAALEAAGLHEAADLIRQAIDDAAGDPMIARIRNEPTLDDAQRDEWVSEYRRAQADTVHYFELRLADRHRRARTERTRGDNHEHRAAL